MPGALASALSKSAFSLHHERRSYCRARPAQPQRGGFCSWSHSRRTPLLAPVCIIIHREVMVACNDKFELSLYPFEETKR